MSIAALASSPYRRRARIWWLDTLTGQRGLYEEEPSLFNSVGFEAGEENWWIWDQGNSACDCNRATFFLGAELGETPCGDGRFVIERREAIQPEETH